MECSAPTLPQRGSSISFCITSPFVLGGRQTWITQPGGRPVSWPENFSQVLAAAEPKTTRRQVSNLIPEDEGRRELCSSILQLYQPCSCCSSTAPPVPSSNTVIHNNPSAVFLQWEHGAIIHQLPGREQGAVITVCSMKSLRCFSWIQRSSCL